jgi:hypothetical protein
MKAYFVASPVIATIIPDNPLNRTLTPKCRPRDFRVRQNPPSAKKSLCRFRLGPPRGKCTGIRGKLSSHGEERKITL